MTNNNSFVLKATVLVVMIFALWACATVESNLPPGETAQTLSSPDFQFRPGLRVAVLPFTVLGNPDVGRDISEADKLSMKLQDVGFVIIESLIFQDHTLHLQGLIPDHDWEAVRQVLNIDYMVFGTINYSFTPSDSLAGKGRYTPSSASVRLVDTNTGEVVMISATDRVRGSMAEEIGESIKNHLSQN